MNANDISLAAARAGVSSFSLCKSARDILPVLRQIRDATPKWHIWLKPGIVALIKGLEAFVALCNTTQPEQMAE